MKSAILIICLVLMGAVSGSSSSPVGLEAEAPIIQVPEVTYAEDEVFFDKSISLWRHIEDSSWVSGYIVENYPDGRLSMQWRVFEGKREGRQLSYFPNGQLQFKWTYLNNRLHGEVKRWSVENGYGLLSHLTYKEGRLHGEQKTWYNTGELHKVLNLMMGREEGMQRAYRKNGALYANYESRDGRIYGLKRSNLCYELRDEQVVYIQ